MNIAFISTAHIHTRGFLERIAGMGDDACAYAIWDDVADRGQRYAAEFGAAFVPELGTLLRDRKVDGFMICAENTKHLALLRKVLPRGKPVFCDKPLVTRARDVRSLARLLNKHGDRLICGYYHVFTGELRAARKLVDDGSFGDITRVKFRNSHNAAYGRWFDNPDLQWFLDPALSGGGAFMDMGTHAVHVLRSLFGPVVEVSATIGNQSGAYPSVDDFGIAHLKFASGVLGVAEAAWTHIASPQGLEVIGSKMSLWHDGRGYVTGGSGEQPVPLTTLPERPQKVDRLVALFRGELSEEEVRTDLYASADAVAIMEAAYAASRRGKWMHVSPREVTRPTSQL